MTGATALLRRPLPARPRDLVPILLVIAYLALPVALGDFWLSVLVFAGIFAVGAIGLDLLTGYTGQISLGHAFFMAVGAYTAAWFGAGRGLSILVWLPLAALAGAFLGAVVGPAALRLRGPYLAIVSVGLVFVGLHVWNNFESVSGGAAGIGGTAPAAVGPLDFNRLELAGQVYSREQSWFWLVWAVVAVVGLLARNLVRSRPGRAMQTVRDQELAAATMGIDVARVKVGAFAVSGALAAVAGGLYFAFVRYAGPDEWNLFLSIHFVAILIVGGAGTLYGPVLGAVVLGGLPRLVEEVSPHLPFLTPGGLTVANLNRLLFGLLIVAFLIFQPRGLAGACEHLGQRFRPRTSSPTPPP